MSRKEQKYGIALRLTPNKPVPFDTVPFSRLVQEAKRAGYYRGAGCPAGGGHQNLCKTIGARSASDSQRRYPQQQPGTPATQTHMNSRKCGTGFIFCEHDEKTSGPDHRLHVLSSSISVCETDPPHAIAHYPSCLDVNNRQLTTPRQN